MIIQFAIPTGYFLPRSYVGSLDVGLRNKQEVLKELEHKASVVNITYGQKTESSPAAKTGITTDAKMSLSQLSKLEWTDRIIPFKPLYLSLKEKSVSPVVSIDKAKVKAFAQKSSQQLYKSPVDASATIKDGALQLTDDISGMSFGPEKIENALINRDPFSDVSVSVKPTILPAATQKKELLPLEKTFVAKTAVPLKITYGNTTKTVGPNEYSKWLKVIHSVPADTWKLGFDATALDAQTQAWAKEYNIGPGTTQVNYLDDVEIARRPGAAGRALDVAAIRQQLDDWLAAPSDVPVRLANVTLAPQVVATRTYSYSSAQLQQKLNAWIKSHPGTYQVAIRELNGRGREASHNVAQQTIMASTYKIFLAFVAYRQAESGALDLGTTLPGGKSISSCIEAMIVNSENNCAVELGRHIGWAKTDQIIAAAGFEATVLNNYDASGNLKGDKLVNANQQARFLAQLSAGSLINTTHTSQLLGYMKRQAYREGIPAGSRGAEVADKVGFLDNYIHDVGIVYTPKSTYALVIMSAGSSWSNIRNLAEAVYDFMSQ